MKYYYLFSNSDIQADDDQDHRLSRDKLFVLTSCQPLLDYLVACDHILYQCIVNFLISNVLRPIPATLTQSIRNFAKNLENWMNSCLEGYPVKCVQAKVSLISMASGIASSYVITTCCLVEFVKEMEVSDAMPLV